MQSRIRAAAAAQSQKLPSVKRLTRAALAAPKTQSASAVKPAAQAQSASAVKRLTRAALADQPAAPVERRSQIRARADRTDTLYRRELARIAQERINALGEANRALALELAGRDPIRQLRVAERLAAAAASQQTQPANTRPSQQQQRAAVAHTKSTPAAVEAEYQRLRKLNPALAAEYRRRMAAGEQR